MGEMRMFQSHAGSIEAPRCGTCISTPKTFQSHAGSIEARHGQRDEDTPRWRGFNPTLVRLRPELGDV